jgi:hypothetical protein
MTTCICGGFCNRPTDFSMSDGKRMVRPTAVRFYSSVVMSWKPPMSRANRLRYVSPDIDPFML